MPKRFREHRVAIAEELGRDPDFAAIYLNAAIEDSGPLFLRALRDVAESYRIAAVAEHAGLSRESLYRTLSEEGNPRFNNLRNILDAVGLRLKVESVNASATDTQVYADGNVIRVSENLPDIMKEPELTNA